MPSKKGARTFANIFCTSCKSKIGVTEFNKKNHTIADMIDKFKTKFCKSCRSHQPVKIKELKQ